MGVITTHVDDISGRGEPDLLLEARGFSEKRFGELQAQEWSFVRAGMELDKEQDSPVALARKDFTKNLKLLLTFPALRAGRKELLSIDYIKLRQCKSGELRSIATVSRPDICARLARIASRINAPCGSDAYRINVLARVVKGWQQATEPEHVRPPHP